MKRQCKWTSGVRWSTSFMLSLTLGGVGADRFYLGHIATGVAKLLTFGGLGVWTVVDVVLTAVGFLHPSDGSLLLNV
jgi:TM2 domain-containing membrane protein YozV